MSDENDEVYVLFFGVSLVIVLFGALCSFLIWLSGQMSALLTGGGWPDSSPKDCLEIAFHFVRHPGDPSSSWPPRQSWGPPRPSTPCCSRFWRRW
ncbi:hypothetical protein [Actinomadura montaniterrae]|uniref:Uncharacterized protein n=1 Tax=Actinomadura montaniterrae TaxID=1803903 RepID=A0A6L3W717_9ACTN|nr:hypothetical protein [Actinomadura montaniterrae]KAB2388822.1 hypothetical protein F9B16_02585 [Actinomadura montaniterrae]